MPKGLHPQFCLVRPVDLVESAADDLPVQVEGLPESEPEGEEAIVEPQNQIASHPLVVVGSDGEGIIYVVLIGIKALVISLGVEVGDAGMDGDTFFPTADGDVLVEQ